MTRFVVWLGWLLVATLCPNLAAAMTYASTPTAFSWIDASSHTKLGPSTGGVYSSSYQFGNPGTCATNPPAIDDAISDNVPIGFGFTYGGTSFTQVRVMTNGRLQFNDNSWCGAGSPVTQAPYPDGNLTYTMRIYGADLDPSLQSEVGGSYATPCIDRSSCYVSYATIGSAPNRRFVVTWSNVPEWTNFNNADGSYNLQIILQEDGNFVYQYGSHLPAPSAVGAQIGWEITGSDYVETAVGHPADNSAILFAALQPLIVNGGFEAGAGGNGTYTYGPGDQGPWVFTGGAGITGPNSGFTSGNSPPPQGRLAAFLQNASAITQTGTVATAGIYMLTFRAVNRANHGCQQNLTVRVDGTTVLSFPVPVQPVATEWMHVATPSFALATGSHTVQISGIDSGGDCTAFVDDVQLQTAPIFAPTQVLGSFEEWQIGAVNYHYGAGAQPWTFGTGTGLVTQGSAFGSPPAPAGNQAAFVQNGGTMAQTWTDPGGTRQITFMAAARGNYAAPTLNVSVDGTVVGTWTLGSAAYASFTTAPIVLAAGPHTIRFDGVGGGDSFIDEVSSGGATPSAPGGFNAFESSTPANRVAGVIHTKISAASFGLDIVVVDPSGSRSAPVLTTFTGNVAVELLDAADNSGALDAGGCRASWNRVAGNSAVTLTFAGADAGRKTVTLAQGNAWRDMRVRMTYTPASGAAVVACSTDNFAVRPAAFASFAASDGSWQRAGVERTLDNVDAVGGNVHKAGRPFTVAAVAVDANGSVASNYTGAALPALGACSGTACVAALGSLTLTTTTTAGSIRGTASYAEVGSFTLRLSDSSFAAVDAADGSSSAELTTLSPIISVGRFVPDHFDLVTVAAPRFATFGDPACAARSFTYIGQPFGYATVPRATVLARNAAGATTANYSGAMWKLGTTGVSQTFTALPAAATLDSTAAAPPSLASNGDGTGNAAATASDRLRFTRPTGAPPAPFAADIALTWTARDASDAAVPGNGTITTTTPLAFPAIAFDAGNEFRFGVLRLMPAYGSELVALPVLAEAQYWDGQRMATNAADQCTAVPAASTAMANYQRQLSACKTAVAAAVPVLASGRTWLKLARPGNGNAGSVDLAVQLGSTAAGRTCAAVGGSDAAAVAADLPWLQGKWNGAAAYDQNPTTRASFGQYRSPLIYLRESF